MKRMAAFFLAALMCCTGCSDSNQTYYEHAQRYLGCGEYEAAAEIFDQLGEYRDAADYALYARGLYALEEGDHALARTNFTLIDPFKSSGRYLEYLDALDLKAAGELSSALEAFEALGSFGDSHAMVAALKTAIPLQQLARCQGLVEAGNYDQALALLDDMTPTSDVEALMEACRAGIQKAQYDKACLLYQQEDYEAAMAAFEAMGDVLDAPARVTLCRSAMYRQAASLTPAMENAAQLMADFLFLEDYLDSADHLAAIEAKYAVNLALAEAGADAWVQLGEKNGAPLLWQVKAVDGYSVTLLTDQPLLAEPPATPTDIADFPALPGVTWDFPQATVDLDAHYFTSGTGAEADPFR